MNHYSNQRVGIALVVVAIVIVAVAAPMTMTATVLSVFCAVIGGFLIDS